MWSVHTNVDLAVFSVPGSWIDSEKWDLQRFTKQGNFLYIWIYWKMGNLWGLCLVTYYNFLSVDQYLRAKNCCHPNKAANYFECTKWVLNALTLCHWGCFYSTLYRRSFLIFKKSNMTIVRLSRKRFVKLLNASTKSGGNRPKVLLSAEKLLSPKFELDRNYKRQNKGFDCSQQNLPTLTVYDNMWQCPFIV